MSLEYDQMAQKGFFWPESNIPGAIPMYFNPFHIGEHDAYDLYFVGIFVKWRENDVRPLL